jgi:hypothetical protein
VNCFITASAHSGLRAGDECGKLITDFDRNEMPVECPLFRFELHGHNTCMEGTLHMTRSSAVTDGRRMKGTNSNRRAQTLLFCNCTLSLNEHFFNQSLIQFHFISMYLALRCCYLLASSLHTKCFFLLPSSYCCCLND